MRSQPDSATLDGLLDGSMRRLIEQRFWEPIEANASLEVLRRDDRFLVDRRAGRNSDIDAEQPVEVVLMPGELYTREWFRPYEPDEIADLLRVGSS